MDWVVWIVLVVLVLAVLKLKRAEATESNDLYSKRPTLFSPAERSFLGVLDQAVGDRYRIFGQVRMADVIEPRQGLDRSTRQKALNRVVAKHFDFVLCSTDSLAVRGVIELDDKTHAKKSRQARDVDGGENPLIFGEGLIVTQISR